MLAMLESIQVHLGIPVDDEVRVLEETAKPEELAQEIENAIEQPQHK